MGFFRDMETRPIVTKLMLAWFLAMFIVTAAAVAGLNALIAPPARFVADGEHPPASPEQAWMPVYRENAIKAIAENFKGPRQLEDFDVTIQFNASGRPVFAYCGYVAPKELVYELKDTIAVTKFAAPPIGSVPESTGCVSLRLRYHAQTRLSKRSNSVRSTAPGKRVAIAMSNV